MDKIEYTQDQWFFDDFAQYLYNLKYPETEYTPIISEFIDEAKQTGHITNSSVGLIPAYRILLINLFVRHYITKGEGCLAIFTSKEYFETGKIYKVTFKLSCGVFRRAIQALEDQGYIEYKKGYRTHERGQSSKIKATQKLYAKLSEYFNPALIGLDKSVLITYREIIECDGTIVKLPPTPVQGRRGDGLGYKKLLAHTLLLEQSRIYVGDIEILNFQKVSIRRFQNQQCNVNGRMYGAYWQRMNGSARQHITINGETTVEIDISSAHPLIAYALAGHDLTALNSEIGKPYAIEGMPINDPKHLGHIANRMILKKAMLMLFNGNSEINAAKALLSDITEADDLYRDKENKARPIMLRDLFDRVGLQEMSTAEPTTTDIAVYILRKLKEKHHRIEKYFYNDAWKILNLKESEIALKVITHFTNKGIPCLSIHDSYIVPVSYKEELMTVLCESIASVLDMKFSNPVLLADIKDISDPEIDLPDLDD